VPRPRFAAHRGGAALWPENSLAAFRGALALGIDLLELDVHLSADGEVVVIHDATLERTTEGTGPVHAATAAALRALRLRDRAGAATGERVPMLDDVLALAAGAGAELLLELKGPGPSVRYGRDAAGALTVAPGPSYAGLEERVLARLQATAMAARTTVMAFNPAAVSALRALAPAQRTTLLVAHHHVERAGARATETPGWAARLGATDLGLEHTLIDADVVAGARAHGLRLGAWTPNDASALRRLAALGVDVITTDRPDLAVRLRDGAG
jgi:glycerophosphoryl diester phosphodiesterase